MQDEIRATQQLINKIVDFFVSYGFQVVGAILLLVVGLVVARLVSSFLMKLFERKKLDVTLSKFIASAARVTILTFVIIIALGKFGITIAPIVAALAAMVFGASFAIQGPLSNYGAGLVIIFGRPFVVGNMITVAGVKGVVEEVGLGSTILTDEDGVKITIPNKHVVGEILHNSRQRGIVEAVVRISYNSNPEKAISIIRKVLGGFEEVIKEPVPQVGIQEFGDSSINIGLRYWVPSRKYFQTLYDVNLSVYKQLKEGDIEIPFPQRDVHIISRSGSISSITS